jgi:light-regulated signal transduction histidine kinase (bacteriophytochrome)
LSIRQVMKEDWFRSADFLQHLFNVVPSLLFIVDRDLKIVRVNEAALKLTGERREKALLQRGGNLLHCIHSSETPGGCGHSPHCSDCVIRRSVAKTFEGKNVYRETTRMRLLSGDQSREIYFLITTSPIEYGEKHFALLVMEDVTEQKIFEEELKQHAARLEAAYRDMESFSYSASHDLRSPLIAIEGFARILMEDYGEKFNEEVTEMLGIIGKNAKKMEQLLSDLLAFSRISTKEVGQNGAEVDMDDVAKEVIEELRPAPEERSVRFETRPLPPAFGNRSMLRQVFYNLLSNALKFTGAADTAVIEIGGAIQGDEKVYYVRDNGVGFDMEYAGRLFGLFSRLHSADKFEGTGIGLVIIKRVIEKHGGRVWAEGKLGGGATFRFALPVKQRR